MKALYWALHVAPILAASIGTPTEKSFLRSRTSDVSLDRRVETASAGNVCGSGKWALTVENYEKNVVSANSEWWFEGAVDTNGVKWQGVQGTAYDDFSNLFGTQVLNEPAWTCTKMSDICSVADILCTNVGATVNGTLIESEWGWDWANQLANFAALIKTLYDGVGLAGERPSSIAPDMVTDFTTVSGKNYPFRLKEVLYFISATIPVLLLAPEVALAAVGISKTAQAALGGLATVASSLSTLLYLHFTGVEESELAEKLEEYIASLVDNFQKGLDSTLQTLFGQGVTDNFNIFDILGGGNFLTTDAIPDTETVKLKFQALFIFRTIYLFWQKEPYYGTFEDLEDDEKGTKCLADQSGVQETKYCGDGGVYYFSAWQSAENSYVTAPKGWDKLNKTEYNISIPWVTESAAKSYRAALANGVTGTALFNITNENGYDEDALVASLKAGNVTGVSSATSSAGGFPLRLCDLGKSNWSVVDWTKKKDEKRPPCSCGPNGSYTAAFYDTFPVSDCNMLIYCQHYYVGDDNWPAGVTNVSFGMIKKGYDYEIFDGKCKTA